MKNANTSSLTKLFAGLIIGIVIIFLIGTAVNGWQKDPNGENSGEFDTTIDNADKPNGDTNINGGTADNISPEDEIASNEPKYPDYTNYLTGLETSAELSGIIPYAFVTETSAPLYGISDSELTIEIPIENGESRFLIYRTDISNLGKIGAVANTRDYISQIVKFFGGVLVANGDDDIVSYSSLPSTLHIDLSKKHDYIYRENGKNIYPDYQNVMTATKDEGIDISSYISHNIPFEFCDYNDSVHGKTKAENVCLPFGSGETSLVYNSEKEEYMLLKNGREKIDMLNGKTASYQNAFVLFADMITYEMSSGTETVVNTAGKGTGYYITCGTLTEIRWSVDQSGQLLFKNLNGEKLVVNRGNSYIGYYKASEANAVYFE